MADPTLQIELASLQIDDYVTGETLKPREPKLGGDGVLYLGTTGEPWRYLPEGYAAPGATSADLQALATQLQALRDIVATDADLEAELAEIQATIEALAASGATDAEVAGALGPINATIADLISDDVEIQNAIAALQNSLDSLNSTYATDLELAQALANVVVMMPIRSAAVPASPAIGTRWIELDANGAEKFDQPWIWRGEWQLERLLHTATGTGRISGSSAPRMDLGLLPAYAGLLGYRLKRATLRHRLDSAGAWSAKLRKFSAAATITDWLPIVTITGSGLVDFAVPVGAGSLIDPLTCPALELTLSKSSPTPDSIFILSCQWAAVRA